MKSNLNALNINCWMLGLFIFIIGIMNLLKVHPFPGVFYILYSFLFYPFTNTFLKKYFNFSIPFSLKLVLFILIMWPTLAVGELAEMYGL